MAQYFNSPDTYVRFTRGIQMSAVPLHGVGYIPDGPGPFPLVLIVHGNHDAAEFSYPGYDYLTSHLASHGMIAISVEEDFLNGFVSGEMDARGIVLLRTLQLFREWNQDSSHLLYQRVDMENIGIAGHSRGGEAAGAAWQFNWERHDPADPDHDFDFSIKSLFAIAPVDGQLFIFRSVILQDVDYFIMHGSHDGDVSDFQGMQMYDRAFPVDQTTTGEKGALFIQGANHGQWNEVWAPAGDPWTVTSPDTPLMSIADQQQTAINFLTGFMRWTLQGRACYRLMAAGEETFPSWPTGIVANRQYQGNRREFINHYQEDFVKTTASWTGGTNSSTGLTTWSEANMSPGQTRSCFTAWNMAGTQYRVDIPPIASAGLDQMDILAFRVGQAWESSDLYNVHGQDQDFSVRLVVGGVPTVAVVISDYRSLVSPTTTNSGSKTVFDTVRVPLEDLNSGSPLLPSQVEAVIFEFDQKSSGLIGFDDIRFTTW